MKVIPLTVIGGYLGSGKTTLLNRLLRDPGGRRLGVIVNDFGALSIDAELLRDVAPDGVISLPNGCICCTLGVDLHEALTAMTDAADPPDHIVIEASGVADPAVAAAWGTVAPFEPGGVFVLAAADSVRTTAADRYVGGEVARQLAGADVIVVSRSDLCTARELDEVGEWLDAEFPGVPRLTGTAGDVPVDVLLGLRPGSAPDLTAVTAHDHDDRYTAWEWSSSDPVDGDALDRFLSSLPRGVVRAKGVVALADGAGVDVQVVGRTVRTAPRPAPRRSQLVVISRAGTPQITTDPAIS